jgi:hypothetical protein
MTNDEPIQTVPPIVDNVDYVAAHLDVMGMEGAARLIRRLRDERDQARAALARFADASRSYAGGDFSGDDYCDEMQTIKVGHLRTAARVHAETGEKG